MSWFWNVIGKAIDRNEDRKAAKRYREMVGMDLPIEVRRERARRNNPYAPTIKREGK